MDPQPSVGGASVENGMGEFFAEEESLKFGGHDGKAGCDDAFSRDRACNGTSIFETCGWERRGRL